VGNLKWMQKLGVSAEEVPSVGTTVHVALDGVYAGYILVADAPKSTAAEAIHRLKKMGVKRTVMLTGDAEAVAEKVATDLQIDEFFSELLPADKVAEVERLLGGMEKIPGSLIFVGDGINDAPVLTRADIGVAMGALGSDAAIEAADVVLMDDDPGKVATAIALAKRIMVIVHQNIGFSLGVKFACLALGAVGVANMWFAIFADVGVMVLAVLNATRALRPSSQTGR
jgi:Cd2+/Zn2+-exporting ATPase